MKKNSKSKTKKNPIPIEQLINNHPETLFNKQTRILYGANNKNNQQSNNPSRVNIRGGESKEKRTSSSMKNLYKSHNDDYFSNNILCTEKNTNINRKPKLNINTETNKNSNENKNTNNDNKNLSKRKNTNTNNKNSSSNKNFNSNNKKNTSNKNDNINDKYSYTKNNFTTQRKYSSSNKNLKSNNKYSSSNKNFNVNKKNSSSSKNFNANNKYSSKNNNFKTHNNHSSKNISSKTKNKYSNNSINLNPNKTSKTNKIIDVNNIFNITKNSNELKSSNKNKKHKNQLDKNPFNPKQSQKFRTEEQQKINKQLTQEQKRILESIQNSQPVTNRSQKNDKKNFKNSKEHNKKNDKKNNFNYNNINEKQLKENIEKIMNNKNRKVDEKSWGKIVSMRKSVKLSPEELMRLLRAKNGLLNLENNKDNKDDKNDENEILKEKLDELIKELIKTYDPDYINPNKDKEKINLRAKSFERMIIDPNYVNDYKVYKGNNKENRKTFVERVKELDKKEEIINNDIIINKHKRMFQNIIENKKNNFNKDNKEEKNDESNIYSISTNNNLNSKYVLSETSSQYDKNWDNNKKFDDLSKKYFSNRMFDNNIDNITKTESSYKNKYLDKYIYGSNYIDDNKVGHISKKTSNSTINKFRNSSFSSNNIIITTDSKINDSNLKSKNIDINCCLSERSSNKNNNFHYCCSNKILPQNETEKDYSIKNNIVNETFNKLLSKNRHKKNIRYDDENLYNFTDKSLQKNFCFSFSGIINNINNKINELKTIDNGFKNSKYKDFSFSYSENNYSRMNNSRKNSLSNKSRKFRIMLNDVSNKISELKKSIRLEMERSKGPSLEFQLKNIDKIVANKKSKSNSRTIVNLKNKKKSLLDDIRDLAEVKRKYKSKNYI